MDRELGRKNKNNNRGDFNARTERKGGRGVMEETVEREEEEKRKRRSKEKIINSESRKLINFLGEREDGVY